MKRNIAILGTLLITTIIIISGSAVAVWIHAISQTNHYCSNANNAVGAPNDTYASLGQESPVLRLGVILLNLGSDDKMANDQDFIIYAQSPVNETYNVSVSPDTNPVNAVYVGSGWDTENLTFQTPSSPQSEYWQYIVITGTSGITWGTGGDYEYGPDIDAVGWWKP